MKLWILRPNDARPESNPWNPWYDKAFGFVVRAVDEPAARILAAGNCGAEGSVAWLNPSFSTCDELLPEGAEAVILCDFASA